ncbi:hypothetical protein [Paenibacillus abyssi]|uniref:Amino acid ABC transporter substrate-binding protein n=1 Tax=Paenibacillus abyssi TaxID=1340531 RepID=A0A917G3L8_9BACL|nr:hypothetical protein [Paenibacillus abyssi]GGG21462.1 hypothetical protein GCM10010916_42730 [Paenibacillus abyssi]
MFKKRLAFVLIAAMLVLNGCLGGSYDPSAAANKDYDAEEEAAGGAVKTSVK